MQTRNRDKALLMAALERTSYLQQEKHVLNNDNVTAKSPSLHLTSVLLIVYGR